MANEYDKILRNSFKTPKAALLRQLIGSDITSIQPLVPKIQQTIMERETDTVAGIETRDGKQFILHIEWQSSNNSKMAARMAMYDLLLHQTYQQEVMGVVLYVGNELMTMNDELSFFGFNYQCKMIDVRQLQPEPFLASDDAGEVVFAVLTGTGSIEQKATIIAKIFYKLQEIYKNDTAGLLIKIKQLELLSLLRGEAVQQIIIKEGQKMPVTIDITKDLRYQKGLTEGIEKDKIEIAEKLLKSGLDIHFVQNITNLPINRLEEIARNISIK